MDFKTKSVREDDSASGVKLGLALMTGQKSQSFSWAEHRFLAKIQNVRQRP